MWTHCFQQSLMVGNSKPILLYAYVPLSYDWTRPMVRLGKVDPQDLYTTHTCNHQPPIFHSAAQNMMTMPLTLYAFSAQFDQTWTANLHTGPSTLWYKDTACMRRPQPLCDPTYEWCDWPSNDLPQQCSHLTTPLFVSFLYHQIAHTSSYVVNRDHSGHSSEKYKVFHW